MEQWLSALQSNPTTSTPMTGVLLFAAAVVGIVAWQFRGKLCTRKVKSVTKRSKKTLYCPICVCDYKKGSQTQKQTLYCRHSACKRCIRQWIITQLETTHFADIHIRCIDDECDQTISKKNIRALGGAVAQNKLKQMELEAAETRRQRFHSVAKAVAICLICTGFGYAFHTSNDPLWLYALIELVLLRSGLSISWRFEGYTNIWKVFRTKSCPKCRRSIEKNGGCQHITCTQCHWEWCWYCKCRWRGHSYGVRGQCQIWTIGNAFGKVFGIVWVCVTQSLLVCAVSTVFAVWQWARFNPVSRREWVSNAVSAMVDPVALCATSGYNYFADCAKEMTVHSWRFINIGRVGGTCYIGRPVRDVFLFVCRLVWRCIVGIGRGIGRCVGWVFSFVWSGMRLFWVVVSGVLKFGYRSRMQLMMDTVQGNLTVLGVSSLCAAVVIAALKVLYGRLGVEESRLTRLYFAKHCKACPNCGIPIEQDNYHLRMQCSRCNVSFCWKCCATHSTSQEGSPLCIVRWVFGLAVKAGRIGTLQLMSPVGIGIGVAIAVIRFKDVWIGVVGM